MILAACRESNSQVDQAAGFENIMKRMGATNSSTEIAKRKTSANFFTEVPI